MHAIPGLSAPHCLASFGEFASPALPPLSISFPVSQAPEIGRDIVINMFGLISGMLCNQGTFQADFLFLSSSKQASRWLELCLNCFLSVTDHHFWL